MAWTVNNSKYKPGDRFGYITLIEDTGKRTHNGSKIFLCECECGKRFIRSINSITRSIKLKCIISCGCKKPSYDIGKKYQYDKERIERSKTSLGMISGTTMQGIQRKKLNKNNTSGYRGVSWSNNHKKWKASIMICRKNVGIKYFEKMCFYYR